MFVDNTLGMGCQSGRTLSLWTKSHETPQCIHQVPLPGMLHKENCLLHWQKELKRAFLAHQEHLLCQLASAFGLAKYYCLYAIA